MRQHAMMRKQLHERQLQTVREISIALGEKDSYTQAHGHRVAIYAMRLAERVGFSPHGARDVGIGGLFHDVGKLALSDRIFTARHTRLSNDLKQEVRCHPLIGAALIKNIAFLEPAVDFVLFHHEREDGNGYPFGLKSEEIPPGAKIVSIADCFDAVTTDRPYNRGQPVESAFEILREGCRCFFCEAYVAAFIEEIEENGMIQEIGPNALFADRLIQSAAGDAL